MRKFIFISLGGAAGAICRYLLKSSSVFLNFGIFPLDTLVINISGSFLLAVLLTMAFEFWEFDADIRLGMASGFLGAFTTFSTLCRETAVLLEQGYYQTAAAYIAFSAFLGLAAAYLGLILARELIQKLVRKDRNGRVT